MRRASSRCRIISCSRTVASIGCMGIPVFPYRAFRHSTLYVRKDSPLREPVDLRGMRVGVPDFSMTAAVWTRGILADQYDVQWQDLHWVTNDKQRFATFYRA